MHALSLRNWTPATVSVSPSLDAILERETANTNMVYLYHLGGVLICFERSDCVILSLCSIETAFCISAIGIT